jgi:hypothetical protein
VSLKNQFKVISKSKDKIIHHALWYCEFIYFCGYQFFMIFEDYFKISEYEFFFHTVFLFSMMGIF